MFVPEPQPDNPPSPEFPAFAVVRNRSLFADYYLREHLPRTPEWQAPEGLEEAFRALLALYRERSSRFSAATNEPQTEAAFIRPALDVLWGEECRQVQVALPGPDDRGTPDYALFRNPADREAAEPFQGAADYWRSVGVLGDAKAWPADLDRCEARFGSPSTQIAFYLYRANVSWGILTNGRRWRLYERDRSRAGGIYCEVDLEVILRSEDLEAFRYFFLLFRRASYVRDASGRSFIETVLRGSDEYAWAVGDEVKESVYDALRLLMNACLEHPRNSLDRHDPETLARVHENGLILLYRLLFLLYAEDRDLLPVDSPTYRWCSFQRLLESAHAAPLVDSRLPQSTTGC